MKKIALCLVLGMITVLNLNAQNKTIFDLWDIPKNGCSLEDQRSRFTQNESVVEDGTPSRRSRVEDELHKELFFKIGNRFSTLMMDHPELSTPVIQWSNKRQFFRQNNKWGLRSEDGIVLIEARFDYIISDTSYQGFVAYNDGKCNYYTEQGKSKFDQSFYHIQPTLLGPYIVRSKQGFGLIDEIGNVLLEANNDDVSLFSNNKAPYFFVKESDDRFYLLSVDGKRRIYYSAGKYEWRFLDDRYAYLSTRGVLIDLIENKEVFCGDEIFVKILNWDKKLLTVYKKKQRQVSYIVHLDGHLLTEQAWQVVPSYYAEGYIVVGRPAPPKPNRRPSSVFGLIDSMGQIVLDLEHENLPSKMVGGKYLQIRNASNQTTLIDLNGDSLFDFGPYQYFSLNEEETIISLFGNKQRGKNQSRFYIETGILEAIELPEYWDQRPYLCMDDTVYIAKTRQGEVLLNNKKNVLVDSASTRIFKGPEPNTFITYQVTHNGHRQIKRQWLGCSGEPHVFRLEGQKVDTFFNLLKLDQDFYFVATEENAGYFSTSKKGKLASNHGWTHKQAKIASDYILSVGGFKGYGWVDEKGNVIIPPVFESIWFDRSNGVLNVESDDETVHVFTQNGGLLFDGTYRWVKREFAGLFKVKKDDKFGLLKHSGEMVLPVEYAYLWIRNGIIGCRKTKTSNPEYYDLEGRKLE